MNFAGSGPAPVVVPAMAGDGQSLPIAAAAIAVAAAPREMDASAGLASAATSPGGATGTGVDDADQALMNIISALTKTDRDQGPGATTGAAVAPDQVDDGAGLADLGGPTLGVADAPSPTALQALASAAPRTQAGAAPTAVDNAHNHSLPLAEPTWFAERLTQQIAVMLTQNAQHARIEVNPPDLGPVEVRVSMNGDEATIQLAAPHAATREALTDALPRLRASFADSGVALGHTGVFAQMPEQRQSGSAHNGERSAEPFALETEAVAASIPVHMIRLGLVDAFV